MTSDEKQDLNDNLKLQNEKYTMTGTTITDSGASITITITGQQPRNIMKSQIVEITVVKTNIIKIDIGQGPLDNLFIPYSDVSFPQSASPLSLKDAINALLAPASSGNSTAGMATEQRQIDTNTLLTQLNTISDAIDTLATSIDDKLFYIPLIVDNSEPGITYEGYAPIGTKMEMPQWAIRRITKSGDVETRTWANGNRSFTNVWANHENLTYQ